MKSYENAQILRKKEDFLAAREELLLCGAPNCPTLIQNDCVEWLPKLEDAIPLVVFEAKVNGESIFDVAVTEGDKTLLTRLDGKSVEVNPGLHTFKFVRPGAATLEERAIVRRGEKSRLVMASWTVSTSVPVLRARVWSRKDLVGCRREEPSDSPVVLCPYRCGRRRSWDLHGARPFDAKRPK